MTNSSRLTTIRALVSFGVLVLAATSWAQTRPPIVEKLAKTYGLDSFGQVDAIRYTFNVEFPGVNAFSNVGLGAQDRPGHLRGKRQGRQAGEGYVPALAAQQPARQREETKSIRVSSTIIIG